MTPVSINPSSSVDDGGLLDMSLEDAFRIYHKRNLDARMEDREKPVSVHCRQVVRGVVPMLKFLAMKHDVSVFEFTLCISFKVLSELQTIGVVGKLSKSYSSLLAEGIRDALFDELAVAVSGYEITYRDSHVQRPFPMYPQVHSALENVADGCGTSVPRLYQAGLVIALTKSELAADGLFSKAVNDVLKPEMFAFLRYMAKWRKTLDEGLHVH